MNSDHVRAAATRHRQQLAGARIGTSTRTPLTAQEIFARDFPAIVARLDQESRSYCAAYNDAIGFERLVVNNHPHGINVSSAANKSVGARFHFDPDAGRLSRCLIEIGDFHEHLKVDLDTHNGTLRLTLNGIPISEEQLITALVDRFTDKLTEIEGTSV